MDADASLCTTDSDTMESQHNKKTRKLPKSITEYSASRQRNRIQKSSTRVFQQRQFNTSKSLVLSAFRKKIALPSSGAIHADAKENFQVVSNRILSRLADVVVSLLLPRHSITYQLVEPLFQLLALPQSIQKRAQELFESVYVDTLLDRIRIRSYDEKRKNYEVQRSNVLVRASTVLYILKSKSGKALVFKKAVRYIQSIVHAIIEEFTITCYDIMEDKNIKQLTPVVQREAMYKLKYILQLCSPDLLKNSGYLSATHVNIQPMYEIM